MGVGPVLGAGQEARQRVVAGVGRHDRELDLFYGLLVAVAPVAGGIASTTSLVGDPEIPGVDEAQVGFVGKIQLICREPPQKARAGYRNNVSLLACKGRGIAAMAVCAGEGGPGMGVFDPVTFAGLVQGAMATYAADLTGRDILCVGFRQVVGVSEGQGNPQGAFDHHAVSICQFRPELGLGSVEAEDVNYAGDIENQGELVDETI